MDELEIIREQNRWNPEKQEEQKQESLLSKSTIMLMTGTALFFDALQALLTLFEIGVIISPFISIFAGFTFFVWFKIHGINFIDPKRLPIIGGSFIVELIPIVDMLPTWTAAVWYTISTTKITEAANKVPGGKIITMANSVRSGKKAA